MEVFFDQSVTSINFHQIFITKKITKQESTRDLDTKLLIYKLYLETGLLCSKLPETEYQ